MGTGQCGARQGPLCGCHHPRLIKGSGCSSCCFQTHSPTLTLTLAARLLHGSGSLAAPGPRGLAEPGAGWQDAVSDDILLVADSDPFPRPRCGVCHTTPSPSQGEVCCPAVWREFALGRAQTWKHCRAVCPQGRDFSFSACSSPVPPQGFERLYPEVCVLQQHLRGWQ